MCRGICDRFEFPYAPGRDGKAYRNGRKRCRHCDMWIAWDGVRCPCCGFMLSTRAQDKRNTEKARKRRIAERAERAGLLRPMEAS